jgi:hypothetical protein
MPSVARRLAEQFKEICPDCGLLRVIRMEGRCQVCYKRFLRGESPLIQHPRCVHCKQRIATTPRGLCGTCSYDKGLRHEYPLKPGHKRYKEGHGMKPNCGESPVPTNHRPGSGDKISVLEDRAKRGLPLFVDEDVTYRSCDDE